MEVLIIIPLLVLLGVATFFDWSTNTIPNVLTFGGAVFALVLQGTLNGIPGLGLGIAGWLICLACFLPLYMGGGMAAGDVKLIAAVGAFVGPVFGLGACLYSLIAGGLIGLVCIVFARARAGTAAPDHASAIRTVLKTRIPYAGAIAAGTSFIVLVPSAMPPVLAQFGAFQ